MKRIILFIGIAVLLCVVPSLPITIHVPGDSATIQGGINGASNGDTVLVHPGIYQEHINFLGKAILVTSEEGPEFTIIRIVWGGLPVISFQNNENRESVISGFTIEGFLSYWGIDCNGSSPTIYNNILTNFEFGIKTQYGSPLIRKNEVKLCYHDIHDPKRGGAFTILNTNYAVIDSNLIHDNYAVASGAIFIQYSNNININRNIIYGNYPTWVGGLELADSYDILVLNNTFANNSGSIDNYATISMSRCSNIEIRNNIIAYNNGEWGFYSAEGNSGILLDFNDFYNNELGDIYGLTPGTSNIYIDPQFLNFENSDYSLVGSSPCIDAGDPSSPLDPDGTRADMGALYFDQSYRILNFHLCEPYTDQIYTNQPTYFVWNQTSDIDSGYTVYYKYYIDDDPSFSASDSSGELVDTFFVLPDTLERSTKYYWKVLAYNYHATPIWSDETWNFYIDGYPTMAQILAPENGTIVDSDSYLSWIIGTDPDPMDSVTYTLQVDDDPQFGSPEIDVSGITRSGLLLEEAIAVRLGDLTGFENLESERAYYWRVRSDDLLGLSSDFTDGNNYFSLGEVINHPPYPPTSGFSPDGDEEIISLTPTITWNNASDPDPDDHPGTLRYYFHLIEDTSTGGYMYSDTTEPGINQVAITEEIPDNSHFMYFVKTVDDEGLESEWSDFHWFWTNHYNYPPEPFPLYTPAPDLRRVDYFTYFHWGNTGDYDPLSSLDFTLQISPDSLFNYYVLTIDELTDTALTMVTDTLALASQNLYWRVLAIDDDSLIRVGGLPEPEVRKLTIVKPGDSNGDGSVIGSDVTYMVNYFRSIGPAPNPRMAGDTNGDCILTGPDVTYLLRFFRGIGPAPQRRACEEPVVLLKGGK